MRANSLARGLICLKAGAEAKRPLLMGPAYLTATAAEVF
jgi:hypothetical protein